MSDDIINQNADGQEVLEQTPTATTNPPVEENNKENKGNEQPSKNNGEPATAHDDFDWSVDKRNVTSYNEAERKKYE